MSCENNNIVVNYNNVIKEYIVQRDGWTPVFSFVPFSDGSVMQLVDYVGGEGSKPTANIGWYLGASGYVENIGDATVFGIKGEQGEQGEKGDQGEQGIQGEPGEKGEKGDPFVYSDFTPQQLEDLKGEKGDTGETGEKGSTGETGEQGIQGETGFNGWTPIHEFEADGVQRQVKKLVDYIGGTGDKPTLNIGQYVIDGDYTTDKSLATNFKGNDGGSILNINPDSATSQIRMWEGTLAQYDAQKPLPTDVMVFITYL